MMKSWMMMSAMMAAGLAITGAKAAAMEPASVSDAAFFKQLGEGAARIRARAGEAASLSQATNALRDATHELTQAQFALATAILNDRTTGNGLRAFLQAQETYKSKVAQARSAAAQCGNPELSRQYTQKLDAFDAGVGNFV